MCEKVYHFTDVLSSGEGEGCVASPGGHTPFPLRFEALLLPNSYIVTQSSPNLLLQVEL